MLSNLNKTERRIFAAAALLLIVLLFVLTQDSFFDWDSDIAKSESISSLIETKNDVRQKYSKKFLWKKLNTNSGLHQGDSIFTGPSSEARIRLKDGSEVVIKENSLVVFDISDNQLDLKFNFGKVKVLAGKVKVNDQIEHANKDLEIESTNKPKSPPVVRKKTAPVQPVPPKLIAPKIINPHTDYVHLNEKTETGEWKNSRIFKIKWAHPKIASNFELQLSEDAEFSKNLKTFKVKGLEMTTPDLPAGSYFVRVKELSTYLDLTSGWSPTLAFKVEEISFDPHLSAPRLLPARISYSAPSETPPTFKWSPVKTAGQYVFELSANPDFRNASTVQQKGTEFTWQKFEKGKFYFRVFPATEKGTRGKVSETGEIKISFQKPVLNTVAPVVIQGKTPEDQGDPQTFNLKWTPLSIADKYQVQLATSQSFEKPTEFETREPASAVTVPGPGEYLVRVKPLASTGQPLTEFSAPIKIDYTLRVPLATPTLLEPAQNMTLFLQKSDSYIFWMEWKPVRQADTYTLQVSTDPNFQILIIDQTLKESRFLVRSKLPKGKLYWRVQAHGEGRQSFWSEIRRMKIFAGKTAELYQKEDE